MRFWGAARKSSSWIAVGNSTRSGTALKKAELEQTKSKDVGNLGKDHVNSDACHRPDQRKEKDFQTDQEEVRWVPPADGEYGFPAVAQLFPETRESKKENFVIVSGIGCSQPLPVVHEHVWFPHDSRQRTEAFFGWQPVSGYSARPGSLGGRPATEMRSRRRAIIRSTC